MNLWENIIYYLKVTFRVGLIFSVVIVILNLLWKLIGMGSILPEYIEPRLEWFVFGQCAFFHLVYWGGYLDDDTNMDNSRD